MGNISVSLVFKAMRLDEPESEYKSQKEEVQGLILGALLSLEVWGMRRLRESPVR